MSSGITAHGRQRRLGFAGLLLAALGMAGSQAGAQAEAQGTAPLSAQERQRIERLLRAIEADTALRFERNGTRVSAPDAVRFLRAKWERNAQGVPTAEAFIDRIASRSSTSGRPYRVCTKPTDCTDAGPWLQALLQRLETKAP